jgi:hypothetical protein
MGPGEVMGLMVLIIVPTVFMAYVFRRFFAWKEKQLDSQNVLAAEKAAQYASRTSELEQRVRVLEQIVTDSGAQTAAQIEALRDPPRPAAKKRVALRSPAD